MHVILTCGKKFNNQSPKNQHGQWSKRQKELVKVLTCSSSRDYRVNGNYTLRLIFPAVSCIVRGYSGG